MFDTGTIILAALLLAAILSFAFMRWRNSLRPPVTHTETSSAQPFNWGSRSFVIALIALGLAGAAQYAIPSGQFGFATLAYGIAILLFISVMGPLIPSTYITEPPAVAETAAKPKRLPKVAPTPIGSRLPILQTWRYYTLADIFRGRQPDLPSSLNAPTPPTTTPTDGAPSEKEPVTETEPLLASTAGTVEVHSAKAQVVPPVEVSPQPTATPASISNITIDKSSVAAGSVEIWSGLGRPQGLVVTPQGNVMILDVGHHLVYCFNPQGQIIRTWSIPAIAGLTDHRFGFSPDSKKLYLADSEHGQVYSITLNED